MSISETTEKIKNAIEKGEKQEIISSYENQLSENIEELVNIPSFYQLPLKNILSVVSLVSFDDVGVNVVNLIRRIIHNTILQHEKEKETILLLQNINTEFCELNLEECIRIIQTVSNCDICNRLGQEYLQFTQLPERDLEFELKEKDQEIEKLKEELRSIKKDDDYQEYVRLLMIDFPPITAKPADYEPDIFKACKEGNLPSVQYLLEVEKTDKLQKNEEGDSILNVAAKNGSLTIVQYLIENQKIDKDIEGQFGCTPLHSASSNGQLIIVEYLIARAGVDKNIQTKNGDTALHYACNKGHFPIVKYLIEKASADYERKNKYGITGLHFACQNGHFNIAEYLIRDHSFNPEVQDKYGQTPLHYACDRGHLNIILYLVETVHVKINIQDDNHETPLDIAISNGNTNVINYLTSKGAIQTKDEEHHSDNDKPNADSDNDESDYDDDDGDDIGDIADLNSDDDDDDDDSSDE